MRAIPWSPDKAPDSYGIPASRNIVAVKVETDEGIVGWGNATVGPLSVAKMVGEFGELMVGEDSSQIEYHWQRLYHLNHVQGGPIQLTAISGIEMALWDISAYWIDRRLNGLTGTEYHAIISFRSPIEPEDSQ